MWRLPKTIFILKITENVSVTVIFDNFPVGEIEGDVRKTAKLILKYIKLRISVSTDLTIAIALGDRVAHSTNSPLVGCTIA